MNKNVILTGGGTGGHVYPSLAIYEILKNKDIVDKCLYIGSKSHIEGKILASYGIPIEMVKSAPFAGKNPLNLLKNSIILLWGVFQSIIKIISFKPILIVASGGYVSAPVVIAAYILKPFLKHKIIINEQNVVPGLMNKVASVMSDVVFTSFRESNYFLWSKKCKYAGYPVRKKNQNQKSTNKSELGFNTNDFILLIVGGSLGAKTINEAIVKILKSFVDFNKNLSIIHAIGLNTSNDYNAFDATVDGLKKQWDFEKSDKNSVEITINSQIKYYGYRYINNLTDYMAVADLVISRAGAGTISEIQSMGKAALLIPKKNLPGNHQELNAIELADKNCCELIFESEINKIVSINSEKLEAVLKNMINNKTLLEELSQNALDNFYKHTDEVIINNTERLLANKPIVFDPQSSIPLFVSFQNQFDNLVGYLFKLRNSLQNDIQKYNKNFYVVFYKEKTNEFLKASDFLKVNKGIKLTGALNLHEHAPTLIKEFSNYKGFLRRNILIAFKRFNGYNGGLELVQKGIYDKYFEVRREAVSYYRLNHFSKQNNTSEHLHIQKRTKEMLFSYSEFFEVKMEALLVYVLYADSDEIIKTVKKIGKTRNPKLRRTAINAVVMAYKNDMINKDEAIICLNQIPYVSSEFEPNFNIKNSYNEAINIIKN